MPSLGNLKRCQLTALDPPPTRPWQEEMKADKAFLQDPFTDDRIGRYITGVLIKATGLHVQHGRHVEVLSDLEAAAEASVFDFVHRGQVCTFGRLSRLTKRILCYSYVCVRVCACASVHVVCVCVCPRAGAV